MSENTLENMKWVQPCKHVMCVCSGESVYSSKTVIILEWQTHVI